MKKHRTPNVICPTCGTDSLVLGKLQNKDSFSGAKLNKTLSGGSLYQCPYCSLKFRYPLLDDDIYHSLYNNALVSTWDAETLRPDWERTINYIHKNQPSGIKILDFGCYTGGLLKALGDNYKKYGVEINRAAADITEKKNKACVWKSISDIPKTLRFNVITMIDVIEHVPNPEELLEQLMPLLSSNGILIISTGDANNHIWTLFGTNWWYCFCPEHIAFISRKWLDYFSSRHLIEIIHFETFHYAKLSIVDYMINGLLTIFFGIFPRLYLKSGGGVKKLLGREKQFGPRGMGISKDHFITVLSVINPS